MQRKLNRNKGFWRNERGNVATMFALSLIPIIGAAGVAMDTGQASNVRSYLQGEVDAAALGGARAAAQIVIKNLGTDKAAVSQFAINNAQSLASERYSGGNVTGVSITGSWINNTDFEIVATANQKRSLSKFLSVSPSNEIPVVARAIARVSQTNNLVAFKPVVANLDYEAGDYNRIYVYCYDKSRKNDPDKGRRAETMTAISDNGGTNYVYEMPSCDATKETLSYRLYNVRGMRTTPSKWDNGNAERFNHYSDTELTDDTAPPAGVANYSFTRGTHTTWGGVTSDFGLQPNDGLLETKLCDTLAQCKPISQGGILPEGRNRVPNKETRPCAEGKYMYYGWEDRPFYAAGAPPGIDGWTDRDYDDIRVIVECPRKPPEPVAAVKLIQ